MARSALDRVCIVLDEPQDVVNIAGVVRAMKNTGLSRLRLVRPAEFDPWRITGIAHRSADIVAATEQYDTLDAALMDAVYVVGTTARPRTARRNYERPRALAPAILDRAARGPVALLFGREDRGLPNEALDRCHAIAVIPTAPDYPSLNLAHAVLILAYELLLAAGGDERALPTGKRHGEPARAQDLEDMFRALEAALHAIEFFKAREPESVMRTLRTLLARAEPDLREARLIRAIGFEVTHYLERTGRDPAATQETHRRTERAPAEGSGRAGRTSL